MSAKSFFPCNVSYIIITKENKEYHVFDRNIYIKANVTITYK